MMADSRHEILTVEQTAEVLQVSTKFVYRLIRDETLRAVRLGKFWRVTKAEILRACSSPKMRARRNIA